MDKSSGYSLTKALTQIIRPTVKSKHPN